MFQGPRHQFRVPLSSFTGIHFPLSPRGLLFPIPYSLPTSRSWETFYSFDADADGELKQVVTQQLAQLKKPVTELEAAAAGAKIRALAAKIQASVLETTARRLE